MPPSRSRREAPGLLPLRHGIRNGLVLWSMAAVLGIEIAVALQRGAQWRGDIIWTIDWLAVSFVAMGPVIAGLAAVDTARMSVGAEHHAGQRFWRSPAFAVWVAHSVGVGVTHLTVTAGALFASFLPSLRERAPLVGDRAAALAVLVQVLLVLLFVAIGTLAGRFLSPVIGGIAAALISVTLVYILGAPGNHMTLLHTGSATIPRVGYAYSSAYLAVQSLLIALLVAAALVLRSRPGSRSARPPRLDVCLAAAAVTVVALGAFIAPTTRLEAIDAEPDHCGGVATVPVCFYAQHARVMGAFQDELWALVTRAEETGYGDLVPDRIVEASRTVVPTGDGVGSAFVMPEHLSGAKPSTWEVALGLVQPLHCPQLRADQPPSDAYWDDLRALTATWAMLVDPSLGEANGYLGEPLTASDAATLLQDFQTCEYAF